MSSVSTAFKVHYNQKLGGAHPVVLDECTMASGGIEAPGSADLFVRLSVHKHKQ